LNSRAGRATTAVVLVVAVGLGGCDPATVGAAAPADGSCQPATMGEGHMAWLDNDLAQRQLGKVGGLTNRVEGIIDQAVDGDNERAVVLYDPALITHDQVEDEILLALAEAIREREEWTRAHADWLEQVRDGGGGVSPEERQLLLRPGVPGPMHFADQPLAVEARPVCGDPEALRAVADGLKHGRWLADVGLHQHPNMGWVIDYALGVVEVVVYESPHADRVVSVLEQWYGDKVAVRLGAGGGLTQLPAIIEMDADGP